MTPALLEGLRASIAALGDPEASAALGALVGLPAVLSGLAVWSEGISGIYNAWTGAEGKDRMRGGYSRLYDSATGAGGSEGKTLAPGASGSGPVPVSLAPADVQQLARAVGSELRAAPITATVNSQDVAAAEVRSNNRPAPAPGRS